MMRTTLAFHEDLWQELCQVLDQPLETAGVILAGIAVEDERTTLIGNKIMWVPDSEYALRTPKQLKVTSAGWMPAVKAAADDGWHPIFFHTHPDGAPTRSDRDITVDAQLAGPFRHRGNVDRYVSLIIGGSPDRPSFTGRAVDDEGEHSIDRVRVVGPRLRILRAHDGPVQSSADLTVFDRQIRAFGVEGQRALGDLRVGVVGASGTGSPVIEELIRLGVGQIVVIDHEKVSDTNVTRIHGSTMADVGKAKAELAREQAHAIGLRAVVEPVVADVTSRAAMETLRSCDVVFGCTDDFAGRDILSKLAYYYGILVIDMGVMITPDEAGVKIYGRVNVITPGHPCLYCTGDITPRQVTEDQMAPEERRGLAEEGYAQGLEDEDPAVVAYTTNVSSWAVDTLLQRLFALGADPVGTLVIWFHTREIRSLPHTPKDGCFCSNKSTWGRGDRPDPLDQIWLS